MSTFQNVCDSFIRINFCLDSSSYYTNDNEHSSDPDPVSDYDNVDGNYNDDDYETEVAEKTYQCPGEINFISFSYLCDDFTDCGDGSDEDPDVCAGTQVWL